MDSDSLTVMDITKLCVAWESKDSRSNYEELPVFDEDGKRLGTSPRLLCHRLGLIHKVAYCFIADKDDNALLQTRGGGRLDVAVGGHVSAADASVVVSLAREMTEEIGLQCNDSRFVSIGSYLRLSSGRLDKPRDVNNELRDLYYYQLSDGEKKQLSEGFADRAEKKAVLDIEWFSLHEVLDACSRSRAADGLVASLPYFLLWLSKNGKI